MFLRLFFPKTNCKLENEINIPHWYTHVDSFEEENKIWTLFCDFFLFLGPIKNLTCIQIQANLSGSAKNGKRNTW
jgi:hypothetical protein